MAQHAALAGAEREPDNASARSLQKLLDSPTQVIIETPANLVVSFDGVKFGAAMQAAIAADLGGRLRRGCNLTPNARSRRLALVARTARHTSSARLVRGVAQPGAAAQ